MSKLYKGVVSRHILIFSAGLCLTLLFSFLFVPGKTFGDSPAYIKFAFKILGDSTSEDFSYRSPLYSVLLAGIIKIFGIALYPRIIVLFQFVLIFLTSGILYLLFFDLFRKSLPAYFAVAMFFLNLSTIYFGYSILTETITVFLFISSVWTFSLFIRKKQKLYLFITGILVSFMILARFNTLPIIISFLFLIGIDNIKRWSLKSLLLNLSIFIVTPVLILNLVALNNYFKNNSYYLFPTGGSKIISRNAIIASLNGNELVSEIDKPVFEIFMEAKSREEQEIIPVKKGSLIKADKQEITKKLYSGYRIYQFAYLDLCRYYNLDPQNAEKSLSLHLSRFYKQVYNQNRGQITLLRIYSFLGSFRSSSGISNQEKKNLSLLPEWFIIIYKTGFILISIAAFLFSLQYIFRLILKKEPFNYLLFVFIVLCYSFYLINFVFGTMGDANRFKFPSEPIILGLFVYFIWLFFQNHNLVRKS